MGGDTGRPAWLTATPRMARLRGHFRRIRRAAFPWPPSAPTSPATSSASATTVSVHAWRQPMDARFFRVAAPRVASVSAPNRESQQRPPTGRSGPMTSTRFPRTARVRARRDFDRIFQHGRRVALPVMAVHWQQPAEPTQANRPVLESAPAAPAPGDSVVRLGLAVSRKVDPHAVGRNRIKRVLRDCFRHHRSMLREGDYVVVARVGAAKCTSEQLRHAFLGLLRRAGALPGPAAPVTIASAPVASSPPSESASAPRVG